MGAIKVFLKEVVLPIGLAFCLASFLKPVYKATRYYMDEFHLLLKEEQTAAYSVEIWKRFRKWGGRNAVSIEAGKDNRDYQRRRNGKGFAS